VPLSDKFSNWYIGRDRRDYICILVSSDAISGKLRPPIVLDQIDFIFNVQCKIETTETVREDVYCTVIRLKTNNTNTRDLFLGVFDSIVHLLGATPDEANLNECVLRLVGIFQRMSDPPRKKVAGLFGELVVILAAKDSEEMLKSWRSDEFDRYDFSSHRCVLEVKSNGNRQRIHDISLEQCDPPSGPAAYLASIFVERSSNGTSITELTRQIERKLAGQTPSIVRLREVVLESVGAFKEEIDQIKFDLGLALSSMEIFSLRAIPAIRPPVPENVHAVRFRSDLSNLAPVPNSQVTIRDDLAPIF
jgi:hypothetical protein